MNFGIGYCENQSNNSYVSTSTSNIAVIYILLYFTKHVLKLCSYILTFIWCQHWWKCSNITCTVKLITFVDMGILTLCGKESMPVKIRICDIFKNRSVSDEVNSCNYHWYWFFHSILAKGINFNTNVCFGGLWIKHTSHTARNYAQYSNNLQFNAVFKNTCSWKIIFWRKKLILWQQK